MVRVKNPGEYGKSDFSICPRICVGCSMTYKKSVPDGTRTRGHRKACRPLARLRYTDSIFGRRFGYMNFKKLFVAIS